MHLHTWLAAKAALRLIERNARELHVSKERIQELYQESLRLHAYPMPECGNAR